MQVQEWLGQDNQIGIDIWEKKYRYNNETFDEWLDRVSGNDAELRQIIKDKKFLFGGRTLSNRGTGRKGSYNNCYSRGFIEDDIEDIMQANKDLALTYKAQGGQGVSLSKIRPKGTPIGVDFTSDGIVPFMEIFNTTTSSISQGGSRKGALMISLDIRHKEAENFITIKTNSDKITKANLSLEIDDEFMNAVNEYYKSGKLIVLHELREYNGHKVEYDIIPINLYKLMMQTVYDWAEPGCLFTEKLRNYNLMEFDDDFQIDTTNPCGEQPLKKNMSCNLGSINLSEFVDNPYTPKASFNWGEFTKTVKISVRGLDYIVDENMPNHPLEEQRQNAKDYRNIGLGVFGFANCLFELGIKYGTKQAIDFTQLLFKHMLTVSLQESNALAKELGMFPKCKPKAIAKANILQDILAEHPQLKKDILKYGLRNCSLLSVAPNGSIGTLLNCSGGCEPEFALKYTRHTDNLKDSYTIYSKSIQEYWDINGECEYEELPDYFVTAIDIPWKQRVDMQAMMQRYVDTAISSTVNLPQDTTVEDIEQLYLYGWQQGLKGITIYRAGCAREGILVEDNVDYTNEDILYPNNSLPWGTVIKASSDLMGIKTRITNGCGDFHLQAFFDEVDGRIWETFVSLGHGGGCERNLEFISKLISKCLRAGVPIEEIIDTAKNVRPCVSYVNRTKTKGDTSKGTSCPSAIGYALEAFVDKIEDYYIADFDEEDYDDCNECIKDIEAQEMSGPTCPECGEPLVHEGGCDVCKSCGFSHCS